MCQPAVIGEFHNILSTRKECYYFSNPRNSIRAFSREWRYSMAGIPFCKCMMPSRTVLSINSSTKYALKQRSTRQRVALSRTINLVSSKSGDYTSMNFTERQIRVVITSSGPKLTYHRDHAELSWRVTLDRITSLHYYKSGSMSHLIAIIFLSHSQAMLSKLVFLLLPLILSMPRQPQSEIFPEVGIPQQSSKAFAQPH